MYFLTLLHLIHLWVISSPNVKQQGTRILLITAENVLKKQDLPNNEADLQVLKLKDPGPFTLENNFETPERATKCTIFNHLSKVFGNFLFSLYISY